ncbi:MAG: gamma-glutamyltranspeptidase [Dactylosporangium sp.]|nr:gamma-glutamyltransferase family protein [Dactylosporangium sp.]NNJ61462.1 gamma-glutamyltranspeptidase [Dactylosporangium sp.]
MTAGVAAGHPSTAEVGLRLLSAGGTAADAAVGAVLASCVAETVLTGLCGGGFATYYDATTLTATCLDFFCTVPGLPRTTTEPASRAMAPVEISFGGVPLHFSIGGATIAVPGIPAGLDQLHRRWGRLPWPDLIAPAIELARSGVPMPAAQARTLASIAPAMLPGDGSRAYAPAGRLLRAGELLHHPGLAQTLAGLADDGPAAFYTGPLAARVVEAVRASGGLLHQDDLSAYRARDLPTDTAFVANHQVSGRCDLNRTIGVLGSLAPTLTKLSPDDRAVAIADALVAHGAQGCGSTTNLSVIDAAGNACVVTTTLGIGSGVWVAGTGLHLNSMLGEAELLSPGMRPGDRMPSNMCPLTVADGDGRMVLAVGSAGASRIRSALIHTLVAVLVDRTGVAEAIARPRFHVVGGVGGAAPVVHAEAGYPEAELAALAASGYKINRWDHRSHYFGGVSAVGPAGAAGDPRRGGVGRMLSEHPGGPSGRLDGPHAVGV